MRIAGRLTSPTTSRRSSSSTVRSAPRGSSAHSERKVPVDLEGYCRERWLRNLRRRDQGGRGGAPRSEEGGGYCRSRSRVLAGCVIVPYPHPQETCSGAGTWPRCHRCKSIVEHGSRPDACLGKLPDAAFCGHARPDLRRSPSRTAEMPYMATKRSPTSRAAPSGPSAVSRNERGTPRDRNGRPWAT
jgi:hypothetical protein